MLPFEKLEQISRRYTELDDLLCQPDVLADRHKLSKLNKERTDIEPVVREFRRYRDLEKKIRDDEEALGDPELRVVDREGVQDRDRPLDRLDPVARADRGGVREGRGDLEFGHRVSHRENLSCDC